MISSAMLNGHSGSMSTGHANNPKDMLHRIETMMMMGIDLPLQAIQRQVASALDIIIHLGRIRDKTRKVLMIEEILGYEDGKIQTKTLYEFKEVGTENEKVKGSIMKVAIAVILLITYVFYESFLPIFFMIPIWVIYARDGLRDLCRKKEKEFRVQFSNAIQAMGAALKAGYSVENAIREAEKDLAPMYEENVRIRKEFRKMVHQLDMKMPAVSVMEQFSERMKQEDTEDFVTVFSSAKMSGGDSISIIRNAVKIISGKIDTEQEIQTMFASKKLEFEIMCAVPFFIILYMKLTFGEFLSVLYENATGRCFMTICLIVYIAAYSFGRKIIHIEV